MIIIRFRQWTAAALIFAAVASFHIGSAAAETDGVAVDAPVVVSDAPVTDESSQLGAPESQDEQVQEDESKQEDQADQQEEQKQSSVISDEMALLAGDPATGPWYVSAATGDDAADCLSEATACKTIQQAIDLASDGHLIIVADGVYAEHVAVSKAVTLQGANSGASCMGPRATESVITGDASGAVQILADGVTIDGFQVSSGSNALQSGIHLDSQDDATIKNNLVSQSQIGLYVNDSSGSTVSCNVFDGNNEPGSAGGTGIYSDTSDGLTVDRNEFMNHLGNSPVLLALNGAASHTDFTFSNNEVHDNDASIYLLGISGGTFENNDITTGGDKTGLYFDGGNANVSVTGNAIHDNAYGVLVGDTYGTNSAIVVNRNAFSGNDTVGDSAAVWNYAGYAGTLDATCNWWGAADGPSGVATGTGDAVTGDVDYSLFLTTDDLGGVCGGAVEDGGGRRGGGSSGSHRRDDDAEGQVLGASTSTVSSTASTTATAGPAKFIFMIDLWQGMRGSEVMELQKRLRAEGYFTFPTDTGFFGPITFAAVKAYQAAHGIPTTGYVGPLTRGALNGS